MLSIGVRALGGALIAALIAAAPARVRAQTPLTLEEAMARARSNTPDARALDAGAVRFRPMALTAAAVIAGSASSSSIRFSRGLAISLMAGEVASLLLSRVTVPVLYFVSHHRRAAAPASVSAAPSPAGTAG